MAIIHKGDIQRIEEWRDIWGYEDLYQVSNLGKVKRLDSLVRNNRWGQDGERQMKGRILKEGTYKNGYQFVVLSKDGFTKQFLLHRLVALAFLEKVNNKTDVNHIDFNKKNNNVLNLEWCNDSENQKHSHVNNKNRKHVKHCIAKYSLDGNLIKIYESILSVKEDGYTPNLIQKVLSPNYKNKTAYNYEWKYYTQERNSEN